VFADPRALALFAPSVGRAYCGLPKAQPPCSLRAPSGTVRQVAIAGAGARDSKASKEEPQMWLLVNHPLTAPGLPPAGIAVAAHRLGCAAAISGAR